MSLTTPKRVRTLAASFGSPPPSATSGNYSSDVAATLGSPPPPWNGGGQWTDSPRSSTSSACGSPEFVTQSLPPSSLSGQLTAEARENRRGRPRSEALTTLMIQGSTSPSAIKCTYCNRVFPREKSLQAHRRTHTGERPYTCDYPGCSRAFTQSGQLKTHQRLHTGERPFICSVPTCQQRFTHANRHCPDHPYDQLRRCDDFVILPGSEQNGEVVKWLQKYKMEKEDRTPTTRKTPKRTKPPDDVDNNENVSSSCSELNFPVTPNNPYKSRKGLMVELDMNAGLDVSPIASKHKSQPKVIEWTEAPPISRDDDDDDDDDDDSGDESEPPICSTFNPKKRWLREAWQDDLARPLDSFPAFTAATSTVVSQTSSQSIRISPKKLIRNPNEMRPTVLMVASKDRTMPLINSTTSISDLSNGTISYTTNAIDSNHQTDHQFITTPVQSPSAENYQTLALSTNQRGMEQQPCTTTNTHVLTVPTAASRKWMGALALMQLTTDETNVDEIASDTDNADSIHGDDAVEGISHLLYSPVAQSYDDCFN